jgi:hypothetical protein
MIALMLPLALVGSAAAGNGPYMWGVGPAFSTMAYPGQYPASFPVVDSDVKGFEDHTNEDTVGANITSLEPVKGDLSVGAHGVLYLNKDFRIGARTHLFTIANGYQSRDISLEVDKIMLKESQGQLFVGGGLGFARKSWDEGVSEEFSGDELTVGTMSLRAQAGALYRVKKWAPELNLFVDLTIPSSQEFSIGSGDTANSTEVKRGFYTHGGIQATVYFGDFAPPKSDGGKDGKKDRKGKKKG